jgi:sensor histidine kinase YesM
MDLSDRLNSDSLVKRFLNWRNVSLFWLSFALLQCMLNLLTSQFSDSVSQFSYVAKTFALSSAVWLVLTRLVFSVASRLPFFGRLWLANLFAHLGVCLLVSLVHSVLFLFLYRPLISREGLDFFDHVAVLLEYHLYGMVLIYWFLVLTYQILAYADRYRHSERLAHSIQESLVRSRVDLMKAQLQPHFLFNTLHTIGAMVRLGQKDEAVETIEEFGDLMRSSLEYGELQMVPLRNELAFLHKYLAIEERRFSDRLKVAWDVDSTILDVMIPSLILQPLVENAIRHGVEPAARGVTVRIGIRRVEGRIEILIRDDGVGLPAGWTMADVKGHGIANVRQRLRYLYGDDYQFEIQGDRPSGTEAMLSIPIDSAAVRGSNRG